MSELRAINADGELVAFPGAEQVSALQIRVAELREVIEGKDDLIELERKEIRILRSRLSEMTGERNQSRELDPFADVCNQWFQRWCEEIVPGKRREFNDTRWAPARARAASGVYELEDGFLAIKGASLLPDRISGGKRHKMQEFEYIFRNAQHMDDYIAAAKRDEDEVPTSTPLRVVDPSKELREAFLAHPGALLASKHGDPVRATGFCMECAMESREGIGTLDDGVLHCSNGCTHDVQAGALLDWYRHSGLVRCGECGQRKKAA